MRAKITRFSRKKNLGNRRKKRKSINFAKNDPYSLDCRVIRMQVEKDIRFFRKNRLRSDYKNSTTLMKLPEKFLRKLLILSRYIIAIAVSFKKLECFPNGAIYFAMKAQVK